MTRPIAVGTFLIALTTVVLLAAGARAARADDVPATDHRDHLHHHHFAEFAKTPENARNRTNPFQDDSDAVPAGRKLFLQHCSECHGENAQGGRKAPNLHADEVQNATQGTLFWILSNGVIRKGMPDWSKLPEPERWQIVLYLSTLSSTDAGR